MQQQYNEYALISEQEEYKKEGIEWTQVHINDNKACVSLIEAKPVGIFPLLDEECTVPKGTDETFIQKLFHHQSKNIFLIRPKIQKFPQFIIKHYAGLVTYGVTGFLNKNRDKLPQHLFDRVAESTNPFIKNLIKTIPTNSKQSVTEQFKSQLSFLIQTIHQTNSHYIRCISPNNQK